MNQLNEWHGRLFSRTKSLKLGDTQCIHVEYSDLHLSGYQCCEFEKDFDSQKTDHLIIKRPRCKTQLHGTDLSERLCIFDARIYGRKEGPDVYSVSGSGIRVDLIIRYIAFIRPG